MITSLVTLDCRDDIPLQRETQEFLSVCLPKSESGLRPESCDKLSSASLIFTLLVAPRYEHSRRFITI